MRGLTSKPKQKKQATGNSFLLPGLSMVIDNYQK